MFNFFANTVTRAVAYWCLSFFEQGVNLDFILHQTKRPQDSEEAIRSKAQKLVHYLIPSVMTDIYLNVIQQKAGLNKPEIKWKHVFANFHEYRKTPLGRENAIEWKDLPVSPTHGRAQTKRSKRIKRKTSRSIDYADDDVPLLTE
jgi:hypothetical protein